MKKLSKYFLCIIISISILCAQPFKIGKNGVVVSASKIASDIGIQVLEEGGNAVDAAVAVSFALAVVWPEAGNIGGGGFMVIRFPDGNSTTIDYRETAPLKATINMYLDENGDLKDDLVTNGPLAAGVPGTVAGMALASEKYGILSWNRLLEPAIQLAQEGFQVSYYLNRGLNYKYKKMSAYTSSLAMFYPNNEVPKINDVIKFPDLAATLLRISVNGADEFYGGLTALKIARAVNNNGGIISYNDLKNYRAIERKPIEFNYRGYDIISMPPPSSGGICLAEILKICENFPLENYGFYSSQAIHTVVEAEKFSYANRSHFLGDPDFIDIPQDYLISEKLADSLAREIKMNTATPSINIDHVPYYESEQTTHFSIIDKNGMAVSNTTTLNSGFGSCYVAEGTGILLNNEMDDFSAKPGVPNQYGLIGAKANSIQPKKRMLSSMTPTIVSKNDSLQYILGTPGGSTIITSVAQVIMNLIDYKMELHDAVYAHRFHHQWLPDKIYFEKYSLYPDLKDKLSKMGYQTVERSKIGDLNAISVDYKNGYYIGVADKRRQSATSVY